MMGVGDDKYSVADQAARHALAQALPDERHLDIDSVYDGTPLKGMRVLLTGAEQGLGLEVTIFEPLLTVPSCWHPFFPWLTAL